MISTPILEKTAQHPMLVKPAEREYRTWIVDSRRWLKYQPRSDDIIIATYPKCGTTWMQRIVSLLVFQSATPLPVMQISAWIDRRTAEPAEVLLTKIDSQNHRRFLKSHLPLDGLPFHDDVKYIHVARDGRDACMSFHNHVSGFTDRMLENLDRAGLEDEALGGPYPRATADPAEFFHRWITHGEVAGHDDGSPTMSFFRFVATWWNVRHRPNVLLVHYNDLKSDISGEMARIARFLDISVPPQLWPELIEASSFEAMRRDGSVLMADVASLFKEGSERFFHKGSNDRWRGVFALSDLAIYDRKVESLLSPACAEWIANGRLKAGDPRIS